MEKTRVTRRGLLGRAAAVSIGAVSARGIYGVLDEMGLAGPERAEAAVVRRLQEQYLIESLEVVLDNGVPVVIPPIYNDVFTAKLTPKASSSTTALKTARSRLEDALRRVESPYPATAAGLTIVMAWGLPYFRNYVSSLWQKHAPLDLGAGGGQHAVLDAITFPSDDPAEVTLEDNHVMFKLRSDSQDILHKVEKALFDDPASRSYVGDLFELTSKRMGFLGRGFGTKSVGKALAEAAGLPGASSIPDDSQLMMGFTSTQHAALGGGNLPSFETIPGLTNQWPSGYFAAGCAMHLSHLDLDLDVWYGSFDPTGRLARMFSPRANGGNGAVTLPNGPADVSSKEQLLADAAGGVVGHNATLQQATRLSSSFIDNYGRPRNAGEPVPIREDFNTIDNPFAWYPGMDASSPPPAKAGMHFVVFLPATRLFHRARTAMDGKMPDKGIDLEASHGIAPRDDRNGINNMMRATHRQNFLVPPRSRRSFPLVDLLR